MRCWIALLLALAWLPACSSDKGGPADGGDGGTIACSEDDDCPDGMFCVGQRCVECRYRTDCPAGQTCLQGRCVQDCPADDRCEQGGTCCPGDWECVDGRCLPPCSGQRCGHWNELCCTAGQVCEGERCLVDCGQNERCGLDLTTCCGPGQICYGATCTYPGPDCARQSDCPEGWVCERDLGICIEEQVVGDCLYHPPVGQFSPAVECRWTPPAGDPTPERQDVVMAPVVANLTDDNGDGRTDVFDTPDIAFISYDRVGAGCCNVEGTLRVVAGRCASGGGMTTIASVSTPALDNSGGLAVGDLDGDGVPEIVGILNDDGNDHPQGTVAFRRSRPDGSAWEVYWTNETYPQWNVHTRGGAQPALVDLDRDGFPEVVVGCVALEGRTGALRWDGLVTSGGSGGIGNNAFLGPVSSAADVDLDGYPEVLAGNTCYEHDGTVKWTYTYTTSNSPCGGDLPCDGYTASGNFDSDPEGEVVIVRQGEVFVLEHGGGLKARIPIPLIDCQYNESGPPTVADFDKDGRAEIGTAAADYYVVADLDCLNQPLPAGCDSSGILWKVTNQDCSSRVTASSVFDFDGDGKAEVIYADETTFRILDGLDGSELYRDATHRSHTRLEMAVIADVDNDGNAEILIASNRNANGTGDPGVRVWGDGQDNWVFTRRIWNQHAYHVSNVDEDGKVPAYEEPNWSFDYLNNFRQNTQGEGLFWAPDLVLLNLTVACQQDMTVYIAFDIMNQGSRMVPDGVAVTIYVDGDPIRTVRTTRALLPGQLEHFFVDWPLPAELQQAYFDVGARADDVGDGTGEHNECEDGGEDNNTAGQSGVHCGTEM